jgi:DMSO/TMAO reductase YedYZ heme-binding membrane subunit
MTALPWYVARSAGLLAWALLTASILWGLLLSTRVMGRKVKPVWLLDLHRYLGGLATIFTAVHVAAILVDRYQPFSLTAALIPFVSSWRPGAVAWGIVGLYLLLAVELTSLARTRLPRKVWRATHAASFPLFGFATLHLVTAGTDARTWIVRWTVAAAVTAVGGLTAWRLSGDDRPARTPRPATRPASLRP